MNIAFADIQQEDTVRIVGRCCSCSSKDERRLHVGCRQLLDVTGVVSTVDKLDLSIKLWPLNVKDDPDGCGKMWFAEPDVITVELLDREQP